MRMLHKMLLLLLLPNLLLQLLR
jgi:hypothetical protein